MGTTTSDERPTLLLIGSGEPMEAALRQQLERLRVSVEHAPTTQALRAVTAAAPDLVLLVGDAVKDGGLALLKQLAGSPVTSVVPIALLLDDASLDQRLRAFRTGAVAVIRRTASAHAIAQRIAELARELPERPGEAAGELGESTLDELVSLVSQELRSGILSVEGAGDQPVRLVLGAGGPVADALREFVAKLKPLVAEAEPLRYELLESTGGRLKLSDQDDAPRGDLAILKGLRILLMDDDPGRADVLAQALRSRGALVGVTEVSTRGLERARGLDPTLVVLDAQALDGEGFDVVRTIRRDVRLRWAGMLLARWDELWPKGAPSPDVEELAGRLQPLVEPDLELARRAAAEDELDTRLELTGPSRLLRALGRVEGTRHLTFRSAKATIEVDLADGLLVGATARADGGA
ncbi:MAG: hypothetical protein MUE69_34940, partial [Myxococcota bacterium]|nr:hypothetical protein [Myxococcota bacterium]